ncbi:hypothetical protein [Intestinimonas massiliensis (ex Afouda et al. 2020)]|uniref:hypothetical protein n=1 Tax=Intestinimonas massiliensis (ex Afouda et al. 2020) TaxID=1673721 RepID=UPI0013EF37A5|nr:hypothetical protein [Intestinimonas massiliensis (ex Afouda et al. 2020)]
MFFMLKTRRFGGKTAIFLFKKEEKTIAILLQSIYTKGESGAKWRKNPPEFSKVEGE